MNEQKIKELRQQIRDAKRTGDTEWAKELEEELEEELKKEEGSSRDYLAAPSMDETPENDEETIEKLYELNPDVEAELLEPMVVGHLIDPESALAQMKKLLAGADSLADKVERCLKSLVGRSFYRLEDYTF